MKSMSVLFKCHASWLLFIYIWLITWMHLCSLGFWESLSLIKKPILTCWVWSLLSKHRWQEQEHRKYLHNDVWPQGDTRPNPPASEQTHKNKEKRHGKRHLIRVWKLFMFKFVFKCEVEPWPAWLSWLGVILQSKVLLVRFPIRAQAWVVVSILGWGASQGQPIDVCLSHGCFSSSLSPSLPLGLK